MRNSYDRIWYVSKYANIAKYGADTRQAYFCKEFVKMGYDVTLLLSNSSHLYSTLPQFRGPFKKETYNGVNVVWLNVIQYQNPNSIFRILSWIHFELLVLIYGLKNRKVKPDVVIASSLSILSAISGSIFKRCLRSKFIFEVRDIWPQSLIELKGLKRSHPLVCFLSWVEKLGYRRSDVIVGTMGRLRLHVERQIKEFKNVTCIPHGVSVEFYENEQVEIEKCYVERYFSVHKPNLVYAGSFNQAYKLSRFIALAKNAKGVDVNFILIGDGPEAEKLKEQSKGISNLTIASKVNRAALNSVLRHADVLLHSFDEKPVFKYGVSPNKFVDYMYAGKPTICIGNVYCPMLEESGAGVVIAPDDAQAFYESVNDYLKMSKEEKVELGIRSRQYILNELSYEKLAEKYSELFSN
ncbi:WblI protein [Vibrio orientalis CIP 102891 = ATCC 33934]|uniref:Probable glycosyltransferase n=1 Tax=Vibrio orientalis CIP 102891 = ATCC 33934 TaxID=675816 RepID=C9QDF6_VIBOR|nr:glycosyltransferase family 4 protein [Vibrio orientalis]EEX95058.1 probable glycosyltransferase [Vibrio orientalis CIP 102891 = ATCC 33934]EGU52119.1 WblI protein [Vibrio orientalis CIP 102891 = ATCC 33934]